MAAPLTRKEVEEIEPKDVHRVLRRVMLVDGFDLVRSYFTVILCRVLCILALEHRIKGAETLWEIAGGTGLFVACCALLDRARGTFTGYKS